MATTGEAPDLDGPAAAAAARGGLYGLCANVFTDPDDRLYGALASGDVHRQAQALMERTGLGVTPPDLRVGESAETLSARFNDLFVIGYSEVIDPTDGTVEHADPPVSLYESAYRPEVSWNDINLDLARAYDYFGIEIDADTRRNHDHLRLQLEFMGYLCRLEATGEPTLSAARLDFHDRHLRVLLSGLAEALAEEEGTGLYGRLGQFLNRFTAADQTDLAARVGGGTSR